MKIEDEVKLVKDFPQIEGTNRGATTACRTGRRSKRETIVMHYRNGREAKNGDVIRLKF